MAYSLDLREKAVAYVESGETRISAAKVFGIGERTIRRWISLQKETGNLKPRPHKGSRKPQVQSLELEDFIRSNPDKTLHEIAEEFNVNLTSIWRRLKKMDYVFKKNSALRRERRKKACKIS